MKTNPDDYVYPQWSEKKQPGITKREDFIKAAMQGLLVNPNSWDTPADILSELAIQQVDSIFKRMDKEKK